MTFKINVKIDYKEAEIEGYGLVKVRPLGAGEELELAQLGEEITALEEPIKELKDTKESKETREKVAEYSAKIQKSMQKLHQIIASSFTSDDPEVAKRLTNQLPVQELARIQKEILTNA